MRAASTSVGSGGGTARVSGLVAAGATALVSGVAVFLNSYGVHAVPQAAVYTTGKNLVTAVVLLVGAGVRARMGMRNRAAGRATTASVRDLSVGAWLGLAYVGVVGGGIAFVMFFVGLAETTAEPAAFLHDTLVIWVALLALPFLGERVSGWNVGAIVLLVGGQVAVTGGVGALVVGRGQELVLGATVLWAVETVVAKRLLRALAPTTVATARMGVGAAVLVAYVALTGHLGALVGLDAHQLGWVLGTGLILAVYVSTWMVALARARAVDVTSVLVGAVLVTAVLGAAAGRSGIGAEALGLVMVALGCAAATRAWPRAAVAQ